MYIITIPPPVPLEHLTVATTGKHPELPFPDLIREYYVHHPSVMKGLDGVSRFLQLQSEVRAQKEGDKWEVSNDDWEFLCDIAKTYNYQQTKMGDIKLACLPFVKALLGAEKKAPQEN